MYTVQCTVYSIYCIVIQWYSVLYCTVQYCTMWQCLVGNPYSTIHPVDHCTVIMKWIMIRLAVPVHRHRSTSSAIAKQTASVPHHQCARSLLLTGDLCNYKSLKSWYCTYKCGQTKVKLKHLNYTVFCWTLTGLTAFSKWRHYGYPPRPHVSIIISHREKPIRQH